MATVTTVVLDDGCVPVASVPDCVGLVDAVAETAGEADDGDWGCEDIDEVDGIDTLHWRSRLKTPERSVGSNVCRQVVQLLIAWGSRDLIIVQTQVVGFVRHDGTWTRISVKSEEHGVAQVVQTCPNNGK